MSGMSFIEHLFPYRNQTWAVLKPAVTPLTREQLEWKPLAGMGIGKSLWHMADCEQWWIQDVCRKRPTFMVSRPDVGDIGASSAATRASDCLRKIISPGCRTRIWKPASGRRCSMGFQD